MNSLVGRLNNINMKKILVPCDFSKPAINAYRFAIDVAAQSEGHSSFAARD